MLSCICTVHYLCRLLRLSVLAPFWRYMLSSQAWQHLPRVAGAVEAAAAWDGVGLSLWLHYSVVFLPGRRVPEVSLPEGSSISLQRWLPLFSPSLCLRPLGAFPPLLCGLRQSENSQIPLEVTAEPSSTQPCKASSSVCTEAAAPARTGQPPWAWTEPCPVHCARMVLACLWEAPAGKPRNINLSQEPWGEFLSGLPSRRITSWG